MQQRPPRAGAEGGYLDGFVLLEGSGVQLPDDAVQADVSGKGLTRVIPDDLLYFVRLSCINASDNELPLEAFGGLPRLRELQLACNSIRSISPMPDLAFPRLQKLDLSYNSVPIPGVVNVCSLGTLQELDLSGNGLSELPNQIGTLVRLERLVLEHNQLSAPETIMAISRLPGLREAYLAYNYFTTVPHTACEAGHFEMLDTMDISFNYVSTEEQIMSLIHLPKITRIMLYGNPLLGPSGEDPTGWAVQQFVDNAIDARNAWVQRPLEVITEFPRKRNLSKKTTAAAAAGRYLMGRQATYRDFPVLSVDKPNLPSAKQFKAGGNQTLFEQATAAVSKDVRDQVAPPAGTTFLTDLMPPAPSNAPESADLSEFARETRRNMIAEATRAVEEKQEAIADELQQVPHSLAQRALLGGQSNGDLLVTGSGAQPQESSASAFHVAINALRFALDHPLTSDQDDDHVCVQSDARGPLRGTELSERRAVAAREVLSQRRIQREEEQKQDTRMKARAKTRFAREMAERSQASGEPIVNRDTLDKLENVLDDMNAKTRRIVAENKGVQSAQPEGTVPASGGSEMGQLMNMVGELTSTLAS